MNAIKIERVTVEDAKELLEIYAPYVTDTAISFEYEVPTLNEFQNRIKDISSVFPYIKATKDNKIIGYAYAHTFINRRAYDWSVELTIYLKREERGHGIGKMLYQVLEKSLKKMGILNMNACIAITKNEDQHLTNASQHFHEKMGFHLAGTFHNSGYKFNTWYDMIWMEKIIGEHISKPQQVQYGAWTIE